MSCSRFINENTKLTGFSVKTRVILDSEISFAKAHKTLFTMVANTAEKSANTLGLRIK
jgi:hypothetical protein